MDNDVYKEIKNKNEKNILLSNISEKIFKVNKKKPQREVEKKWSGYGYDFI